MHTPLPRILSAAAVTAAGLALFALQQRIPEAWAGPERTPLEALDGSRRQDLGIAIQVELTLLGFDPGGVDGILGPHSQKAIRAYRQWSGETDDGSAESLLAELRRHRISRP